MIDLSKKDFGILVVEDERPLSDAIRAKLENEGCDVVVARTVDQAINYLKDVSNINAIWLDHYLLGKENGLDFMAKIKSADSAWKHIPVFVVSNTASHDKVQSYMQLGVNKFYVKSDHRLDEIINDIKFLLNNRNE